MEQKNAVIHVDPLGPVARLACLVMRLPMHIVSGTVWEEPKSGIGPLNYMKLSQSKTFDLDNELMVFRSGIPGESCSGLKCHMPIFGGWRNYVVLKPSSDVSEWHVGFLYEGESCAEVCREENVGAIRMLVGGRDIRFFGIDAETGKQISLDEIGSGRVGDRGKYSMAKLL